MFKNKYICESTDRQTNVFIFKSDEKNIRKQQTKNQQTFVKKWNDSIEWDKKNCVQHQNFCLHLWKECAITK